jgi:hypothetical protein
LSTSAQPVSSPGRPPEFEAISGKSQDLGTTSVRETAGELLLSATVSGTPFEVVAPDGKRITGVTPARLEQLNPGSYTVSLRPAGLAAYEQTVQISAGQSINLDRAFSPVSLQKPPAPPIGATESVSTSIVPPNVEMNRSGLETHRPKVRSKETSELPEHRKTPLTKSEAFRRFDAEFDGRERAIDRQILATDQRIISASGKKKEDLKAWKKYLEQRRQYVRKLRRYEEVELRSKWNE